MKRLTTEEFIQKYNEKYPNHHYDLSYVDYKNSKEKIKVICKIHGEFWIRPNDLLLGGGCSLCSGTKKSNTDEFIKKANYIHNNFFTYEKTKYVNSNEKIIITCPFHGDFKIKANAHLNGNGCPFCKKEHIKHQINKLPLSHPSTKKLTNDDFIQKAQILHQNKYCYNKTQYVKSSEKIIVTCPFHGDFLITPNKHLMGRGCPMCSRNKRMNTQEFIIKMQEKYPNNTFCFDKVNYVNTHTLVHMQCKKHLPYFDFWNQPSNLLKGQGCPKCNESFLEKEIFDYLIENKIEFIQEKKFEWLGNLSLDFFLPKFNLAIECQGIQHFRPIDYFGGLETFTKQQERDKIKKNLCLEHKIKIVYFSNLHIVYPYEVYENKEDLLENFK